MFARTPYVFYPGLVVSSALLLTLGCQRTPPPPADELQPVAPATASTAAPQAQTTAESKPGSSIESAAPSAAAAAPSAAVAAPSVASGGDPVQGKFTLEDATKGLKAKGKLWAEIDTDQGKLKCELFDDKAPSTVANFVGLARGLRPFKDPKTSEWVKRAGYDGTTFHRIIKGFMIQGGDPQGTGAGEPGYVFPDEVWPGATHDKRGLICMANRGPNTNGMQFFIMDGEAKHLDRSYTIFGQCSPDSVIEKIAAVEVNGDRAVKPPKIRKVSIARK